LARASREVPRDGRHRFTARFRPIPHPPRDAEGGHSWPALYTSIELATALGEIQRNIKVSGLAGYRFTELWVELTEVIDCRGIAVVEQLLDDYDYSVGQAIAKAAIELGAEAIVVPSATRLGDNLILFPEQLGHNAVVRATRSIDPRLVKEPPP
jgi:hypothetical protein